MCLFELCLYLVVCPVVGFLGHMVNLFLIFKGISILLSIVAAQFTFPPKMQENYFFLHILSSIYCLLIFLLMAILTSMRWYLEKEKQSWTNQPSWLHTIIQNYSNQDSMILAPKQKYRLMEWDRKPRNKPMHLWVPYP